MSSSGDSSCTKDQRANWSALARVYSDLNEARRQIVFPFMREILRSTEARAVLDYGCGDGRFLEEVVINVPLKYAVNYDPAPGMYQLAKSRSDGRSLRVVQSIEDMEPGSFDAVTCIAVWMCLPTEEACRTMVSEVGRVLRPDGHFIAAVTHPCFRSVEFSTFKTNFPDDMYLRSGTTFRVTLNDGKRVVVVVDTHWNLADISRQLEEGGFVIQRLHELPDKPDNGRSPWLIVHARKCMKIPESGNAA